MRHFRPYTDFPRDRLPFRILIENGVMLPPRSSPRSSARVRWSRPMVACVALTDGATTNPMVSSCLGWALYLAGTLLFIGCCRLVGWVVRHTPDAVLLSVTRVILAAVMFALAATTVIVGLSFWEFLDWDEPADVVATHLAQVEGL